jgi:hypothetical protein
LLLLLLPLLLHICWVLLVLPLVLRASKVCLIHWSQTRDCTEMCLTPCQPGLGG